MSIGFHYYLFWLVHFLEYPQASLHLSVVLNVSYKKSEMEGLILSSIFLTLSLSLFLSLCYWSAWDFSERSNRIYQHKNTEREAYILIFVFIQLKNITILEYRTACDVHIERSKVFKYKDETIATRFSNLVKRNESRLSHRRQRRLDISLSLSLLADKKSVNKVCE